MSYRKTAVALAVILAAQAGSAFADKGGAAHTMWTSSEVPDSTLEYSYEAGDKYGWRAVLYVGSGSETNASGTVNNLHVTSNALVSTGKAQDEPVYGVIVMSDTTDVTFAGDTFTSVVNTDFKGLGGNQATALCVNDGKVSVTADSVVLKSTSAADIGKSAYGLVSWSDEGVTISGKTLNVEVKTNTIRTDPGHYSDAAGLAVYAGETSVTTTEGAKITVTSTADETAAATTGQYAGAGNFTGAGIVYGAVAGGGSLTLLGTSDINVTSVAAHASGITVRNFYKNSTEGEQFKNSALTLDTSTIRVHSQSGNAFGLDAELVEGTDTYDVVADVKGGLTVHAVSDEAAAYGVRLSGKATIALKGNLDITAQGKESFALYTDQGNLAVSGNTAVLKGNVRAANGGTITFGNPESIGMRTARAAAEANTASVTEVVLEGNMTSTSDSTITFHTTNVTLGAGNIINLEGTTQAANSQILVQALPEGDKPVISVKSLAAKSTLGVRAAGSLNDSLKGDINAFAKTLAITGDGVAGTEIVLEEGMYEGAASAELASDGTIDTTTVTKPAASSVMTDSLTIATAAQLSLNRILMNDVRKRMGDLRSASEASGVWARYDGGKLSGSEGLENQFNTIQIGADTAWGSEVRTGVAASYTTGDTDYSRGSADTDTYSFAAYGTWMADNGFFGLFVHSCG